MGTEFQFGKMSLEMDGVMLYCVHVLSATEHLITLKMVKFHVAYILPQF